MDESNSKRKRALTRRCPLLAAAALALLATAATAERQLAWRPLAVEARLDADGVLWVRESHTMVFTGDWNGGERIFRLEADQTLDLHGLERLDPETGESVPLGKGSLSRVDHYDWIDRRTLRWRSRRPSDPPFDGTAITYVLEYRQGGVLQHSGERYLLDHDFAFPDRVWPVEGFTMELELDPIWRPAASLASRHGPVDLAPGQGWVVTAELDYTGEGRPAGVRQLPSAGLRGAVFGGALLAVLALLFRFYRREASLGRFTPPPVPAQIDTGWLEEHLFDLLPEEAGALWDRKVGPPEVAAILARWQAEGRIDSRVIANPGLFKKDVLELELKADRTSFEGYEAGLVGKLFFGGRQTTDTEAIRKRYRTTGFDPAATVRRGIERRLKRLGAELERRKKLPGSGKAVTVGLLLAAVALLLWEAQGRGVLTLQLALLAAIPFCVHYLLLGLGFARAYRNRVDHLGWWALGFLVPVLGFGLTMAIAAFFDRLLPGVDFTPQPGLPGTAALALLWVMVSSSLLNQAACRERRGGLERRQRLAAARRLFKRQLERQAPELADEWMPYLLALGLGRGVDRWWRRFGGTVAADASQVGRHFGTGSSTSGSPSWTGGGGAFGGAGATASWAAVAGSVASGVAKPSSGGSGGGGGGGGGGSSGGGGGGGW